MFAMEASSHLGNNMLKQIIATQFLEKRGSVCFNIKIKKYIYINDESRRWQNEPYPAPPGLNMVNKKNEVTRSLCEHCKKTIDREPKYSIYLKNGIFDVTLNSLSTRIEKFG